MKKLQFCAVLAGLATCHLASAQLTISASVGGAPLSGEHLANFNGLPVNAVNGAPNAAGGVAGPGLTVSFVPDGGTVAGAVNNVNAAPYLSGQNGNGFGNPNQSTGADATTYLTSGGSANSEAVLSFAAAQTYLGILWGSVDTYNTLSFYNGSTLVGKVVGQNIMDNVFTHQQITMGNGVQTVNGTAYVNINSTLPFNRVVATSSQYAFEFDNVAYSAIPEPTTLVAGCLLLLPFGASTLRLLRQRCAA